MNQKDSYTSAGAFPIKLLQCDQAIVADAVVPYHIQLIPTNRCNAKCPWCSCSKVDRSVELPYQEIKDILQMFSHLGTKAVTITGGGEPTLHPRIQDIISYARQLKMDVGIVTNGMIWSNLPWTLGDISKDIMWARYSVINEDPDKLKTFCSNLSHTDVGVSFTVPKNVNVDLAEAFCEMADGISNLTHIRFVQDLVTLDPEGMERLVERCDGITSKAIFQWRNEFTEGGKNCHISKLKPLIDATGFVYPCCGVQYATDDQRRMPEKFRMGHWRDFAKARTFDGSICKVCYYKDYNVLLDKLLQPIEHGNFL